MDLQEYFNEVKSVHKTGAATEHSYRASLQKLFSSIEKDVHALNEPKRVKCGAPDFLINRGDIIIGHVEAKDIDRDLGHLKGLEADQRDRYLKALPNLIYTNCLDFEFYREGKLLTKVSVGDFLLGLQPRPENFERLEYYLRDFVAQKPQSITSPRDLAERMAGKAVLIKDVLSNALSADVGHHSELFNQYDAFKEHLIHDITIEDFADLYAETIAYGMFAARLHDTTLESFTRQEALNLLPKSNPFLRSLFGYIAGHDLDDRIAWIIDDLAAVFQAANVAKIMEGFGKLTGQQDPFLHFYETFLAAYNPAKRRARGVWYTPEAVVNFIVRAVDEVLQQNFSLPEGLADTSKVTIDWDTGQKSSKGKAQLIQKSVHRVQILDPATGTGTFLAEVIKIVAPKITGVAPGMWSKYIETDLIPRLHGFEILMASYAMCHMKLDMILTELKYKPTTSAPPRLSVYLTNSLEEGESANQTLPFAQWLSNEVKQANSIKRDMPIMCVIGNPPYSIMSGNMATDQVALVNDYRSVDGVAIKEKGMLQFEKNINNDYIKFFGLAEKLISKNGYGVLGFITSHGYLKSSSFRGLRAHLMQTFDEIRVLDLHGNSEVRELAPDGVVDKNVFDIKQGVAIIIAYKTTSKASGAKGRVFYSELWGSRESKYQHLAAATLGGTEWSECLPTKPNYTFHPSGAGGSAYTQDYVSLTALMPVYSSGVITARDEFSIAYTTDELVSRAKLFSGQPKLSNEEICTSLGIALKKGWDITKARKRLGAIVDFGAIVHDISYRPFDTRKILFDESVVWTTARATMDHMLRGDNLALVSARSKKSGTCSHFFVSPHLVETKFAERTTQSAVFPLYLYPGESDLDKTRRSNFDPKLLKRFQAAAKGSTKRVPDELEVFDYIYGVLHFPGYRQAYAEFLKIDFPRIPIPFSPEEFWDVSSKGTLLRRLHLMEPAAVGSAPFPFIGEGTNVVDKTHFAEGKVWINGDQHFAGVPEVAWDFFIGGYQPARKWLKDRKGTAIGFDEVKHYQKLLKVLAETHRIMASLAVTLEGPMEVPF